MRLSTRALPLLLPAGFAAACGDTSPTGSAGSGVPTRIVAAAVVDTLTWIGETARVTATVRDAEGNELSDVSIDWRSTAAAVVVVDTDGLATAIANGSGWIVASTVRGIADSVRLIVSQRAAFLNVTPAERRFFATGQRITFEASPVDQGGTPVPHPGWTWTSSDPAVAVIDSPGVVRSTGNGTAEILLEGGGLSAGFTVTVAAPVAFVHANVLPMDQETVLPDRTVLIEGGVISALGPSATTPVPDGVHAIDASGMYLMPGLSDMHVHFSCATGPECRNDLWLYLANGVTTIRSMWGSPYQVQLRSQIENGAVTGPTLIVASPGVDGPPGDFAAITPPVTTPEEARARVAAHTAAGYDFIKVYNQITPELYTAIHAEARVHGIPVLGHKPWRVGFQSLIDENQWTSEHLIGYEQETAATGNWFSSEVDTDGLRPLARQAAAAGMAETPTFAVYETVRSEVAATQASAHARFVSPGVIAFSTNTLRAFDVSPGQRDARVQKQRTATGVLHDEGVPLLLGTDAGVRWVLPGFSIHYELEQMVASGLTPYEALRAGTVNAAAWGWQSDAGTLEPGRRADMILLSANPLDGTQSLRSLTGVMVRGVWLDDTTLHDRLEKIARSYGR